jgi:hypothetical protein
VFRNPFIGEASAGSTSWLLAPGTHIGFGVGLFYAVKKLFEEVEKSLNYPTKLEIAIWLLDLSPTKTIERWQSTFLTMFNKVFGEKHWSWKCFWRSCLFTTATILIVMLGREFIQPPKNAIFEAIPFLLVSGSAISASALPDYFSLWKTRYLMALSRATQNISSHLLLLGLDIILTSLLAAFSVFVGTTLLLVISALRRGDVHYARYVISHTWTAFMPPNQVPFTIFIGFGTVWFIPAFFGRLWLLAYVACGLLLKFAPNLQIFLKTINRRFDIENHPLQSIGVVAGTLVALGYWLLAIIHLLP